MEEYWKPLYGFENTHMISNHGRFRSISTRSSNRVLIGYHKTRRGYLEIVLWKDGKNYSISVHRAIAKAFIPNPENLPEVDHIDGNRENNSIDNLQWLTSKQNTEKSKVMGVRKTAKRTFACCKRTGVTLVFISASQAARYFCSRVSEISWAARNKLAYKNHSWSY